MASFSTSHHLFSFTFLILFLKTIASDPISSFSLTDFEKDPNFKSSFSLSGNAKFVNGSSAVHLSGSGSSGSGNVMYKNPIKLVEGQARELVSFSTNFVFSIPLDSGDGLAFVMIPSGSEGEFFHNSTSELSLQKKKFVVIGVGFSISRNGRNGGSACCIVAINVGNNSVPAKVSNTSSVNLILRRGEKLHAWIDYEASSRRLEVRLSQFGHSRPSDPVLWHSIDFSNVWKGREMFVGFSPLKGNTSQASFIYSWSFVVRHFPHWMHSEPLDPKVVAKNAETQTVKIRTRSDCFLRLLAAMIFGAGCGALTAFIVLYLWTIFGSSRPVVPEECVMQPIHFEYKKFKVVVDNTIKDGKE